MRQARCLSVCQPLNASSAPFPGCPPRARCTGDADYYAQQPSTATSCNWWHVTLQSAEHSGWGREEPQRANLVDPHMPVPADVAVILGPLRVR
jgi:hypothetical protein